MRAKFLSTIITAAIAVAAFSAVTSLSIKHVSAQPAAQVPQFKYDASWPKPLPEGWVLG